MSPLRLIYLGLAMLGAALPVWRFVRQAPEVAPFQALWGQPVISGGQGDLMIAAIALSVWVIAETAVRRNWGALLALPATFLVGIGFGLPLYLFLRARPVR